MEPELPLARLFLHLVHERGFPLTARDYQDALRALALGYGQGSRQSLLQLLDTLWARTDEESRLLNLLFREIPLPTAEEIAAVLGEDVESVTPRRKEEESAGPAVEAAKLEHRWQRNTRPRVASIEREEAIP